MNAKLDPAIALPPTHNILLAALPTADYERLLPNLEFAPLPLGLSLYEY